MIGLSIAYELAGQGADVTLLERGRLGREASWAGAGMLPPGNPEHAAPEAMLRAVSHVLWDELAAELREATGIDNGYVRCGGLHPADVTAVVDELAALRSEGVECERVDDRDLRRLEPGLSAEIDSACHLPAMGQVRNPRHVAALVSGCATRGVNLSEGETAFEFETDGDRVTGVRGPNGTHRAGRFCLAGGAWTSALLGPLGLELPVWPVRGQIVLLRTRRPVLRRVVECGPRYLVPRPDGRLLVGATEEHVGFEKRTTAGAVADLIAFAVDLVPELADAEVEQAWAGLRPGSPDRRPFLDRVGSFENLFVAAGHFREGLQTSPATAVLMREMILEQPLSFSPEPFRVERAFASV